MSACLQSGVKMGQRSVTPDRRAVTANSLGSLGATPGTGEGLPHPGGVPVPVGLLRSSGFSGAATALRSGSVYGFPGVAQGIDPGLFDATTPRSGCVLTGVIFRRDTMSAGAHGRE